MKKLFLIMATICAMLIFANIAQASVVFSDNFDLSPNNNGWNTYWAMYIKPLYTDPLNPFVGLPSGASMWRTISTLNYDSLTFSYSRKRMFNEDNDRLFVGWRLSSGSEWNILEEVSGNGGWDSITLNLPALANNTNIDIGFWMVNYELGPGDFAFIDDIQLLGNHTPEPATLSLLGLGLLGLLGFRKRVG